MYGNKATKELCAEYLHDQNDDPNDHEGWIREYAIKNVYLIVYFPGANHVEDLHEHEKVENNCQVA